MTYSLLQTSLDQRISREMLEEASVSVPGVAKADCPAMSRDMFGVITSALSPEDALAFKAALQKLGVATEVVADYELPALFESRQMQRVERVDDGVKWIDSMGREHVRPKDQLVFVAAGFVRHLRRKMQAEHHFQMKRRDQGNTPGLVTDRQYHDVVEKEFRIDFFFEDEPHRLHLLLNDHSVIFYDGEPLKLRDQDALRAMSRRLAGMIPPVRWNRFLTHMDVQQEYPSIHAYEEELRWHFYRLLKEA